MKKCYVFDNKQFMEALDKAEPESFIIYDEAGVDLFRNKNERKKNINKNGGLKDE